MIVLLVVVFVVIFKDNEIDVFKASWNELCGVSYEELFKKDGVDDVVYSSVRGVDKYFYVNVSFKYDSVRYLYEYKIESKKSVVFNGAIMNDNLVKDFNENKIIDRICN